MDYGANAHAHAETLVLYSENYVDHVAQSPSDNSTGQWVDEPNLLMEGTHHRQSDGGENSEDVEHQVMST